MNLHLVRTVLGMLFCLLACAMAISVFQNDALAQDDYTVYYNVKFVCGEPDGRILNRGNYLTAINVHNPKGAFTKPVKIKKKFTIALPEERAGGQTPFSADVVQLGPDDAIEIDCADILRRTQELCASNFCKGFVVIESSAELDVVAVYTAADVNTGQVATMHTERVPPGCRIVPVDVPAEKIPTFLFVPPDTGGEGADPDYKGNGPCVVFRLNLELEDEDRTLAAKYRMHAYECSDDFEKPKYDYTAAEGSGELALIVAAPHERILGHNKATGMMERYIDTNHTEDIFIYTDPRNPVEKLRFVGDTRGDEAGTKTRVLITLKPIKVMKETCTPKPTESVID